ncbi:MAG: sugar phosphate isomerase/epimerase [Gemmatimonadaceae bacterium]|nr:sugar phosphate isomerase/epimerase [Gemmatimonadaceae bacterium]
MGLSDARGARAANTVPALGIFAKTFVGATPRDVLRQVRAAGYVCAQYNMACSGLGSLPESVPAPAVTALQEAVRGTGVSLAALSATCNLIHPEAAVRDAGIRALSTLGGVAGALHIPVLTLCSGSRNRADQWAWHPDNAGVAAWRALHDSLDAVLAVLPAHGVQVAIEPEPGNVVDGAVSARRLLDERGDARIGIILDPANLVGPVLTAPDAERRDRLAAAVELLAGAIVLVHAKDRGADGSVVAPGDGLVDFDAFFQALAGAGVQAPVITHGIGAGDAPRVATWLRERLALV